MPSKTFHLTVVTPQKIFFDGQIGSLVAPGGAGSLGVLANHAPLLSTLSRGRLVLTKPDGKKEHLKIGTGFLDVLNNEVTLLTESVESETPSESA